MPRSTWKKGYLGFALLILSGTAVAQPQLAIQGSPYFEGDLTLSVTEPAGVGELVWLTVGLDPLPFRQPAATAIGPWFMATLLEVLPLAFMPPSGRLDIPFNLGPEIPASIGVHLVVQAYVEPWLSNPATIPLDQPYYTAGNALTITSPQPTAGAKFGERVAIGDLNGDGNQDIIAGAWVENVGSVVWAGRAYVFWGPDFTASMTLTSPTPIEQGLLGEHLGVGDVDGDGQVDLVLPESPGVSPIPPSAHGHIYVYLGGRAFSPTPSMVVPSAGSGPDYGLFGRRMTLGDFNDDGKADVAVGIDNATVSGHPMAGKIDIHWGPALTTVTTVIAPAPSPSTFFGDELAAKDVTGDGIDDLLVGTSREDVGAELNIGRAYVFAGPDMDLAHLIDNPLPDGFNSRFGNAVAAADLDDDEVPELLVTDQRDHVFIFWSSAYSEYTVINRPPAVYTQNEDSGSYGYEMLVNDVNNDGWPDVIVNDPFDGSLGCAFNDGVVFVALGPYYATHHVLFDPTPECFTEFGWTLAFGDLEGDTRQEFVAGNHLFDSNGLNAAGKIVVLRRP